MSNYESVLHFSDKFCLCTAFTEFDFTMAKIKKIQIKLRKSLGTRRKQKMRVEKKGNLNCAVVLENIDHLLKEYNIEPIIKTQPSENNFNIGLEIKQDKVIIHQSDKENITFAVDNENEIHVGIKIKDDTLTFQKPDKSAISVAVATNKMEIGFAEKRPQRKATGRMELVKKPVSQPEKLPRSKTFAELANDAWKRCKKITKSQQEIFHTDQYVMVKMASYSPWPAKITGFTKNRKMAYVYFFGSHNSGSVDITEITPYQSAVEVIRMQALRQLEIFSKGIKEVEIELQIPEEFSVLNRNAIDNKLNI